MVRCRVVFVGFVEGVHVLVCGVVVSVRCFASSLNYHLRVSHSVSTEVQAQGHFWFLLFRITVSLAS